MKRILFLLAIVLLSGCAGVDVSPDNPWKHTPGNPQYDRYHKNQKPA